MGLFDLFKGKKGKEGDKKPTAAAKWAEIVGNKRAQAYDRAEALQELCQMKTAEAAAGLLRRFTYNSDPSITDQEEKETAFEGIVAVGRDAVVPVRAFASKAESLAWPMRILKELLAEDELVDEMLAWLAKWDTEYAKFIDPKLQVLAALEDYRSPKIRAAVEPFLKDAAEPARFHAVATTLAQRDAQSIDPLLDAFLEEESVRIRTKIADGFATLEWSVPEERRDAVRKVLPPQYSIDGAGSVRKRA
jgi:hypothetical protein